MAEVYPAPQPAKKRRNWKLIGGILAGTIVLMCVCLGFAARSGSSTLAARTATAQALGVADVEPTGEATVAVVAAVEPTEAPTATEVPEPTSVPEPTVPPEPTGTEAPTNTPAPPTKTPIPPTPTEAPTATLPPAPIVVAGEGQMVSEPVEIPQGVYRVTLTHNGTRNFIVQTYAPDGKEDYLTNKIGAYKGIELLISQGGAWTFEVNADGRWTMDVEPIGVDDSAAAGIEGSGDFVTNLFTPSQQGVVPYEFTHDGERNFIVQLVCSGGGEYVQNQIGPVEASAMARFREGPCLWDVNADGNWRIKPR